MTTVFLFSADYMQALQMKFITKEDAIAFADKQGKKPSQNVESLQ